MALANSVAKAMSAMAVSHAYDGSTVDSTCKLVVVARKISSDIWPRMIETACISSDRQRLQYIQELEEKIRNTT